MLAADFSCFALFPSFCSRWARAFRCFDCLKSATLITGVFAMQAWLLPVITPYVRSAKRRKITRLSRRIVFATFSTCITLLMISSW
jgi:hypothetical protein